MRCVLAVAILNSIAIAQLSSPKPSQTDTSPGIPKSAGISATASDLPQPLAPRGKSTVIGGAIQDVDPVRDQLTLGVFGGHGMKILFDGRTEAYRDGKKISLRELGPESHASVETVLDGSAVFALSIHILSHAAEGEIQGQVVNYDAGDRELTVRDTLSDQPVKVRVPEGITIRNAGQAASRSEIGSPSSLKKGSLVTIKFQPDGDGQGVATQIAVLAAPGSEFIFDGNITYFDMHAGRMAIVDPRDNTNYSISFDPVLLSISRDLHEGQRVRVTANFNGERYVARNISLE